MSSVNESLFSHFDVLKQPIKVASGAWASSMAPSTDVLTVTLPNAWSNAPFIQTQLLQVYAFYKMSLKVEVLVNTTRFHCGKLCVWYDPMEVVDSSPDRLNTVYAFTGQPHVMQDAGSSNSVVLNIPFEHLLSCFSTSSSSHLPTLGVVHVSVFNSLKVPTTGGTDPVPVNVFMSAEVCDLHTPMRPHKLTFTNPPTFVANAKDEDKGPNLKQMVKTGTGFAKTAMGAFADLKTGNWGGLWDKAKNFFSLDRPNNLSSKQGNCLATISPQMYMLGEDQAVRLASNADGAYLTTHFSPAPESDMLIDSYIKVPCLVRQVTWSTAQAEDTALATFNVHPGLCAYNPIGPGPDYIEQFNTNLSYVSQLFEQWRGDLTFTVDFAATQFHSGRLMFVFEPGHDVATLTGVGSGVQDFSNNPHLIFDLRENKKIVFTIPYVGNTDRKVCVPDQWCTTLDDDRYTLGRLRILVVSPLVTSESVPDSIDFNVYLSAGENFAFYVPRIRINTELFGDFHPGTFTANAGEEADLTSRKHEVGIRLIKGQQTSCPDYYNEPIRDFRDLARRYGNYDNKIMTLTGTDGALAGAQQVGVSPDVAFSDIGRFNVAFCRYVSKIFVFWSGSIRYKVVPMLSNTRSIIMRVTYFMGVRNPVPTLVTGSAYPQLTTVVSQDKALEFETPFYSPYNQLLCNQDAAFTDEALYSPGRALVEAFEDVDPSVTSTRIGYHFMVAAGNDIAFRMPVSAPMTWERYAPYI